MTWNRLALAALAFAFTGVAFCKAAEPTPPKDATSPASPGNETSGGTLLASPIDWESAAFAFDIAPRLSVRRSFGDGVGYDSGFTYFEGFLPLFQTPNQRMTFSNARIVNFDQAEYWEIQLGGGQRWLLEDIGAVFGLNGFYDGRNTDARWYHQAGIGWELLGADLEFRGNFYIPVGPQSAPSGFNGFANPFFTGTNIGLQSISSVESTMGGLDVEVGHALPSISDSIRASAYLGYYHYSNDGMQTANGIRGRLEAWLNESISAHFAVQNDAVFDTTVTGGLAFHWGGVPRGARNSDPVAAKLGERVVRDPNIVIATKQEISNVLAIDPLTNQPIEVRHVNSSAAPGGDGSYERPFQNLNQLQNGSGQNMILFAHANSVFLNQQIQLKNHQRLLGEGIDHLFVATQGTFLLPRATAGSNIPVIANPFPLNAAVPDEGIVILANNTEVSGFKFDSWFGPAIFGQNITSASINRNTFIGGVPVGSAGAEDVGPLNGIAFTGIELLYDGTSTGNIVIEGNHLSSIFSEADAYIHVVTSDQSQLQIQILNNSLNGSIVAPNSTDVGAFDPLGSDLGILLVAVSDSTITAQVANNHTVGFSEYGALVQTSNGTMRVQFANNTDVGSAVGFRFLDQSGVFQYETTLASNSPSPILTPPGTYTAVPVGTFFPAP